MRIAIRFGMYYTILVRKKLVNLNFGNEMLVMRYENCRIWCVYVHENQMNGKVYIGKSCLPHHRFGANGVGYNHNKAFAEDINLYGWDNFSHEILYEELTETEAYELESFLIGYYHAYDSKYGYNHQRGNHKQVIQCDLDGNYLHTYRGVHEAAKAIGKNHGAIYGVLNGKRKQAFGYKWKWCN